MGKKTETTPIAPATISPSKMIDYVLEWEECQKKADELKGLIEAQVLAQQESFTVGYISAVYSKGKVSFDRQSTIQLLKGKMGLPMLEKLALTIAENTTVKTTETTKWEKVLDAIAPELEDLGWSGALVVKKESVPSVTMKVEKQDHDG